MSRILNLASHDPDKLSNECRRYVAFNYYNNHEGSAILGYHFSQESNLRQRPVVQTDRLEAWVTIRGIDTAVWSGGSGSGGLRCMEAGGT